MSKTISSKTIQTIVERELQGDGVCESILGVTDVTRVPVCGNGICESGEASGSIGSISGGKHTCTEDCALPLNRYTHILPNLHQANPVQTKKL